MKPAIGCVLFDLDGVLADYDRDLRVATLARRLDRSRGAVRAAIYGSGIEDAADAGTLDSAAYLAALGHALACPVSADAWIAARRAATRVRPAMLSLADGLRRRGLLTAVLSNNGVLMAEHWSAIAPALFPLFDGRAWCSAQFGAAKPSPTVYRRCLHALAARPEATLFIDDSAANVAGAREAGLVGHHYIDGASLTAALAELGLD